MLVDTAPLIALIDAGQGEAHRRCVEVSTQLEESLLTTWCCFTEAMYFLYRLRGWAGQKVLWDFIERKALTLHYPDDREIPRMYALMAKYQDVPMDLADASLVAAAESLGMRKIFTLDRDFYIYRLNDQEAFEVIPDPAHLK